jgi:dTDP-4-dehydrorhamnose 3,5-epimerase
VKPVLVPEVVSVLTKQDYGRPGIDDVKYVVLRRFSDDGGSITELARLTEEGRTEAFSAFQVRQVNYSTIEPGVIKAFHVHERQRDLWFVPPEDRVLLVLVDVRRDSKTPRHAMKIMLGDGNSSLVSIPPGVAHGCRNLGDAPARIIYMTDVPFSLDPQVTDEGRLPWDLVGAEIWEPAKE